MNDVIGKVIGDKVVSVDTNRARSDASILKQAHEILEDKERLDGVKLVDPGIEIAPTGKGPAYKGSKPLDILGLQDSQENVHNVFKNVTKYKEKTDG